MAQIIQDSNITTSSSTLSKSLQNDNIKLFDKTLSRLITFDKIMHSSIGKKSFHLLDELLTTYIDNILKPVEMNCYMIYLIEKNKRNKLKKHINNTLIFFHFYWHEIKEHIKDHNYYLNKLSILLAIYVDTELRTCKRNKDPSKIANKLFNILYIYLNKSTEHIFKVLLRIKTIRFKIKLKRSAQICDHILSKIFNKLKTNRELITGTKYIRYLFTLKLWKEIKEDTEDGKMIDELAVTLLGSRMPKMHVDLFKLVPKIPLNCNNETIWLMESNLFNLKQACNDFLILTENVVFNKNILLHNTIKNTSIYNNTNSEINEGLQAVETYERKQQENIKMFYNCDQLFEDHGLIEDINNLGKQESMDLLKSLLKDDILISTEKSYSKPIKENITKFDTEIIDVAHIEKKFDKETSTKIFEKSNIRKSDITTFNEETSVKKRKVTSEHLSILDSSKVLYSTNTQTQVKDLFSGMKDFEKTNDIE